MVHKQRKPSPAPPATAIAWPPWTRQAIAEAVFLAALFLTFFFWIQPRLLHLNAGAEVFNLPAFSVAELLPPGRGLQRLTAWSLQLCQLPALGAVLGAFLVWLFCLAAGALWRRGAGHWPRAAQWLLAPPLLAVFGRYDEASAAFVWAWCLAAVLALMALGFSLKGRVWRWLAPSLAAALAYGGAGAGGLLGFLVIWVVAAGFVGVHRFWALGLWGLAVIGLAGIAELGWWRKSLSSLFSPWHSWGWLMAALGLAVWWMVVGLLTRRLVSQASEQQTVSAARKKGTAPLAGAAGPTARARVLWLAGMAAGVALMLVVVDRPQRATLQLRECALRERWPEFLEMARQQPALEPASRLELVLALYHSGRLLDEWFAFPVVRQDELLPNVAHGPAAYAVMSRVMLNLGQVNHAERFASEALEILGQRPELLEVLAQVNVLKGHPVAAGNYLRALQRQPFHHAAATRWLAQLAEDPLQAREPRLNAIRAVMVSTDYPHPDNPTAPLMQQLLHTNPTNRMAYEFLLAHYLISLQLDKVMEYAERLADPRLGYAALPRHLAEAALLWGRSRPQPAAEVAGFPISPTLRQRFARFDEVTRAHLNDLEAVRPRLAAEFGDTYWYFYLYGRSARWDPSAGGKKP
ncbi:DUF6057 family protein [Fontisphaera persica]|uniref:DUF6057 family protein n=1 Tax=Fontisphaera persica TaxID=2974023 RepID=UPI0024BF3231|nr:DUF6057 family protein [Fontisphaera persica]WCJ58419.1 DUF6057 family protein [Fontisphaera persica]